MIKYHRINSKLIKLVLIYRLELANLKIARAVCLFTRVETHSSVVTMVPSLSPRSSLYGLASVVVLLLILYALFFNRGWSTSSFRLFSISLAKFLSSSRSQHHYWKARFELSKDFLF